MQKVPYKFSMAHLPNCKIKVVLHNLEGQCWTVNSVPTTKVQTVHTFCGGWMAFVRANDIKMGDICIFELVGKCEMRVHVRAGKVSANGLAIGTNAPHSNINGGASKKTKGVSLGRFEFSNKSTLAKTGQDGPFSIVTKKWAKTSKVSGSSALRSQSKLLKDKPAGQNRMSIQDEMGSHAGGSLSLATAPEEDRRIRYFSSSFPNFITVMRKFNVSRSFTLRIPHKFSMAHLPQCETKITLRNTEGECWSVNSVADVNGCPGHTFCGGWMGFVRGNDIKVGDTCIFELVGKCEMCVHVFEAGKKALDHQNGKVAGNELDLE
ncbi:B3 DNA binding domain [Dillenia turbinata]|uniref:B3 DNA binding domain n=1 Tax=Dillenia turbinata TaxID=194707 RepID=A0AAN8ZI93_9MAGN